MLASRGSESHSGYYVKMPDEGFIDNPLLYPTPLDMIFEIHPQLNYEAYAEYIELLPGDQNKKVAERRMLLEENLNKTKLAENSGKPVYIDSIVQLFHVSTNTYLQLNPQKIAQSEMGVIGSSKTTTENCQFKISLPFGFYKKGTPLTYDNSFILQDISKKTIAYPLQNNSNWNKLEIKTFPMKKEGGFNWFRVTKSYREPLPYLIENQEVFKGYLAGYINMAELSDTLGNSFQAIKTNSYFEQSDGLIQWGDNIMIRKMEITTGKLSSLVAETNKSVSEGTVKYRFYDKVDTKKISSIESNFQLVPIQFKQVGKPIQYNAAKSVFILIKCLSSGKFLKEDLETNEIVEMGSFEEEKQKIINEKKNIEEEFKKKQLLYETGNYSPEDIDEKDIELIKSKPKGYFNSQRFVFDQYLRQITFRVVKMSSDDDQSINNSNFFKLVSPSGRNVKIKDAKVDIKLEKEKKTDLFYNNFEKLMQKTYIEDYKLVTSDKASEYDLVYFQEINRTMELALSRLVSHLPSLCRAPDADLIDTMFIMEYTEATSRLINLFNEIVLERELDKVETQNLFRQASVIDLIMRFMSQIYDSSNIDTGVLSNTFEACDKSVQLLDLLTKNNKFNSLYVFQWKNLINAAILESRTDIFTRTNLDTIYFGIIDILQYNWVFTQDFIEPICSRIRFKNYDCHKLEILIKILNAFRHFSDEKSIELIYKNVFKPQNQAEIFKKFKLLETKIVVVEIDQGISEIKINGQLPEEPEKYNYLLTVVKLGAVLADLDLLRVSSNLSEIFPKDACKHLIEDESLSNEFRCLVFNLYASIYILNPVYQYKVARYSDKVIIPDDLDISPSPKKKNTIFEMNLLQPPSSGKDEEKQSRRSGGQIQKAIERVDLSEIVVNVDNKKYLNKFMQEGEENKAILFSSLKITMQLLDTKFFTKSDIIELKTRIEDIISSDQEGLLALQSSPALKDKNFVTMKTFLTRGKTTMDLELSVQEAKPYSEDSRMLGNYSDNSILGNDQEDLLIGDKTEKYDYIVVLMNILLKINEVLISMDLRDSLINQKSAGKKGLYSKKKVIEATSQPFSPAHFFQRRNKKTKSKIMGTKIVGVGVLNISTQSHEINNEQLAKLFNDLKFKNNEKLFKVILSYFSLEIPKLFFKVLEFYKKICRQKYFLFKTLENHYLLQNEEEKLRYDKYKRFCYSVLRAVKSITKDVTNSENLKSHQNDFHQVMNIFRDRLDDLFIQISSSNRVRHMEFNIRDQFSQNQEPNEKNLLSAKETGVFANILNLFYMKLDDIVVNQQLMWKSGFLSLIIEIQFFLHSRYEGKERELKVSELEVEPIFHEKLFEGNVGIFFELNFAAMLLLYYNVYHNQQVAAYLINEEGDKFLSMIIGYLQSPHVLIKKVTLMLLTQLFGSNFDSIYSLNKRYRYLFLRIIEEFNRETKAINYEVLTNYLEFFRRVTTYNNLVFEKNYDLVHEAISGVQSSFISNQTSMITSMMNEEVTREMNKYFSRGDLKKIAVNFDFKKHRQEVKKKIVPQRSIISPTNKQNHESPDHANNKTVQGVDQGYLMTSLATGDYMDDVDEHDSTFTIANIPGIIIYANELMKYFALIGSLGSNDLKLKIRKIVSIDSILGVFASCKEFWFFKITILNFLSSIFINQKLDIKAKGQVFQFAKDQVMVDVKNYSNNTGLSRYLSQIFLKSDFTQINPLFLKKDNDFKISYNFFCYEFFDSQTYYIKEAVMNFMKSFVSVCYHDNNSSVIESLIDMIDEQKNKRPENVLVNVHQVMAGKHASEPPQIMLGGLTEKWKTPLFGASFKEAIDTKRAEVLGKLGKLFEEEFTKNTNFEQCIESEGSDLFLIQQYLKKDDPIIDTELMKNVKNQYLAEFSYFNQMLKIELEKVWRDSNNCYTEFLKQCCFMLSSHKCDSKMILLLLKYLLEQFNLQKNEDKVTFIERLIDYYFVPNFFKMMYHREKDKELVFKSLGLLKELLNWGCAKLQKCIYEEFTKEADNKFMNIVLRYWDEIITNFTELEGLKYQLHSPNTKVKYQREMISNKLDQKCSKQIDAITTILEVLRLLCENHFLKLQNYLRVQTMGNNLLKPAQVNFLEKVIIFFKQYIKVAKEENELVASHILRFLIEMVQGPCKENQVETIKKKLLEPLEDLHGNLIYSTYSLSRESRIELINLILTLKLGLIESTKDNYIVKTLSISLNMDLVWLRITAIYCDLNNIRIKLAHGDQADTLHRTSLESSGMLNRDIVNNLLGVGEENSEASTKTQKVDKQSSYSINMVEALNSMILISQLSICSDDIAASIEASFNRLADSFKIIGKARRFFMDKIRSIEYIDADQNLQTLFFYIHPKTNFLSKISILKFEEQVDRRNWITKTTDLLKFIPKAYIEIKHNYNMFSKLKVHISVSYVYFFKLVNFIIAILVNFMFLASSDFTNEVDEEEVFRHWSKEKNIERTAQVFCYFMIINYCLALFLYMVYDFVVKIRIFWWDQSKKEIEYFNLNGTHIKTEPLHVIKKTFKLIYRILFHTKILQISGLLLSCILGLTVSKLFFSFLLLDIIDISPVLLNVIKSVKINFAALSTTWLFITILIFIYSSIAYFNRAIKDNMIPLDQPELEVCGTFAICFWNVMLYGIKSGGGVGDILSLPDYRVSAGDYAARTIFDMVFWMSMILICINIILGIIIDSFAELRAIRNQISSLM